MCWFSVVNSETEVAQAEINQCLGIRLRLYACPTRRATNWIVPANQLNFTGKPKAPRRILP